MAASCCARARGWEETSSADRLRRSRTGPRSDYWDVTFVGRFVWWLAYSVSTLVLGLVLLLLAAGLDPASVRALRDRLGGTIGFGILLFILLPIVAVLLFVTIVGIRSACSCSLRSR